MKVHSDVKCERGELKKLLTPQIFELLFGHRVALAVSVVQLSVFAVLQEHVNHFVFIASGDFQA